MTIKATTALLASLVLAGCSGGGNTPVQQPGPVNAAPTISPIADQSTKANQSSQPIGFTVTDEDLSGVQIAVDSDNPTVVPADQVVVFADGERRSVTVTPARDTLGDALVTIVITDRAGLSSASSFLLTVTPQDASMQGFSREQFDRSADGDPELVNAILFSQDADDDDFADLLAK